MNISDVLEQQAHSLMNTPCIHFSDENWSYDELNQYVWQIANVLHHKGVMPGDVVAQTFHSEPLLLIAMMATARIGATVFSVSLNTPSLQNNKVLNQINASHLVTDIVDLKYPKLKSILIRQETLDPPKGGVDKRCKINNPTAPWILVPGSGSTGKSKLMPVTHSQQLFRMKSNLVWPPYPSDNIIFSMIELDYFSTKQRYLQAFNKGFGIALMNRGHLEIGQAVQNKQITIIYATVYHIECLLDALPLNCAGYLAPLAALRITGSTVSSKLRKTIREKLCPHLDIMYGANECHIVSATRVPEVYEIDGTVGFLHQDMELQVVDKNNFPLTASRTGQIRIRSKATIDGYFNDQEATDAAFKDDWFYPGDLGKLTPDGQLIYMGRSDDLMIMNGINIYPAEIEQAMCAHADITDAVALPLKHPIHQDIPVCAVTLRAGAQISEQELMAFASQRLGSHRPKNITILNKIPRTERGKPSREKLYTLIASKLNADTNHTSTTTPPGKKDSFRQTRKQLTRKITFTCVIPEQAIHTVLDKWFTHLVLKGDPDNKVADNYPEYDGIPRATGWWLWRCMQLSQYILQACRVPVFDLPEIIAYQQEGKNNSQVNLTLAITRLDNFPRGIIISSLKTSFFLAEKLLTREPNTENLQAFFKIIQNRMLAPYSKVLPPGKSTLPILRLACQKEIPFRHMGSGVYQLGWGNKARFIDRSTTEIDSAMGSRLSQNKLTTTQLLRSAGLPSSRHQSISNPNDAHKVALQFGWPVVVKPSDRDGGVGITVNVDDLSKLETAYALARKLSHSKQVIIEQQVPGVCHRLFIANDTLLYGVKRLPMSVTGDGKLSVSELVNREVEIQKRIPPWKRSKIIPLDPPALAAISAAGFSASSVPDESAQVPLRNIESTEWGGIDEDVTGHIHPENLQIAFSASKLFRLNVAGIDIISEDITKPWYENKAIINEVNFAPLLGGGEISRQHIPAFLDQYLHGNGRIPINVFVGGESAWHAASKKQHELVALGVNAHISNGVKTLDASGKPLHIPLTGLFESTRALVLQSDLEALVLVIQNDEFMETGLPLEIADSISYVDEHLMSFKSSDEALPPGRVRQVIQLLNEWRTV